MGRIFCDNNTFFDLGRERVSNFEFLKFFISTIKSAYNDQLRYPKIVAVVTRWSLFRGTFKSKILKMGPKNDDRCRQVVAIHRWLLAQVLTLL